MSLKFTYYGKVTDGKLTIIDRPKFEGEIKSFEGKRVEITLQKAKRSKTNDQNRYLWGCVYEYALQGLKDVGNENITKDDVHQYLKDKFLSNGKEIIIPETGEVRKISKTTTTLTTTEMMEYVEQIAKFCAEFLGVVIPEPFEQTELELHETDKS